MTERYIVTMSSDVYGAEIFEYDTLDEACEGIKRLRERSSSLNDGIKRKYTLHKSHDAWLASHE